MATSARFLGIDIDTMTLEMVLPFEDKLVKLYLEELTGLVIHCARVVQGWDTSCRCIYDMINVVVKPSFKVRLSGGFHDDRKWWLAFAKKFNRKAPHLCQCRVMPQERVLAPSMQGTGGWEPLRKGWTVRPESGWTIIIPLLMTPVREPTLCPGDVGIVLCGSDLG